MAYAHFVALNELLKVFGLRLEFEAAELEVLSLEGERLTQLGQLLLFH